MALQYGSSSAVTIGTAFNSLASSTTTFAQTNSVPVSTTNNIVDVMVQADISLGTITPSASTIINFYVAASEDGTTWPGASATNEVITGTAGSVTISTLGNNLRFLGSMVCHTSAVTMKSQPMSIASAFGGVLPRAWVLVVQNQTGANLAASGHSASYTEVYYT